MGMDKKYLSSVITSGEAAMYAINQNKFGKTFFHLGPPRDTSVFDKVRENKTNIEQCDFILCTGLFDDYDNDLNFYREFLKKHISKQFICTNPDLTVHRGNIEELCAGSIAKVFEELGGKVSYFGKPYPEVYNLCFNNFGSIYVFNKCLNVFISRVHYNFYRCSYLNKFSCIQNSNMIS